MAVSGELLCRERSRAESVEVRAESIECDMAEF